MPAAHVAVVTDSTSYLSPEQLAELDISIVSLSVGTAEHFEREAEIADLGAFYDRLRTSSDVLKTSQPSLGDFLAVWEPLLAAGRDVVSVHLSSGISGTVDGARQAAVDAEAAHPGRRVLVVDSDTTAGGMGMVVLAVAHAAAGGRSLDEIAVRAAAATEAQRIWFAVDTLEYLRRNGRIGAAAAWFGGALKIKPILTLRGTVEPIERVRTAGRAFARLEAFGELLRDEGSDGWIVQHIQAHEEAERLVARGREIFGSEPLWVAEIGPVIGAHVGPGLLGIGGIPRDLLTA